MDLKLITKRQLGKQIAPGQQNRESKNPNQKGDPDEFFGESSNDIQLNTVNDFELIEGTEKLKQDVNKILLTEIGQNTNFDEYGSGLQALIGEKISSEFVTAKIEEQIVSALEALHFVNRDNQNLDEVPLELDTLDIRELGIDGFEVQLAILTASDKLVTTSVVITA